MFVIWTTRMRNNLNDCYLIWELAFLNESEYHGREFLRNHGNVRIFKNQQPLLGQLHLLQLGFFSWYNQPAYGVGSFPTLLAKVMPRAPQPLLWRCCTWTMRDGSYGPGKTRKNNGCFRYGVSCKRPFKACTFFTNLTRGFSKMEGCLEVWVFPPILRDNSIGTWMFRLSFACVKMDSWRIFKLYTHLDGWVMKCPEEQLWICWSTICLVRHEVTFSWRGLVSDHISLDFEEACCVFRTNDRALVRQSSETTLSVRGVLLQDVELLTCGAACFVDAEILHQVIDHRLMLTADIP